MQTSYRTHTCNQLTKQDNDKEVTLAGWCHARRDHGGVIFIDLRDRYGLTQVVFEPNCKDFKQAEHLGREFVIQAKGKVRQRPDGMINTKLHTGEIEVLVTTLTILSKSKVPPLEIDDRIEVNEELAGK